MTLTQLINEGFIVNVIREHLSKNEINYDKQEGSLSLLEKLINFNSRSEELLKLTGLRTAQLIRTKSKGHSAKKDAEQLAIDALGEHETYAAHFRHVCEKIHDELLMIQSLFDASSGTN